MCYVATMPGQIEFPSRCYHCGFETPSSDHRELHVLTKHLEAEITMWEPYGPVGGGFDDNGEWHTVTVRDYFELCRTHYKTKLGM